MAFVIAQLRWDLRKRAAITGVSARLLNIALWCLAVAAGAAGGFATYQAVRMGGDATAAALSVLTSVVIVVWVASPLLIPTLADPGVDPARLEQFPVSTRTQVEGLALGALFGRGPLVVFLFLCGAAFAPGVPLVGRLLIPVLAVLFALLGVVANGALQALLAEAIKSRRGQDVAIVIGGALMLGSFVLINQLKSVQPSDLLDTAGSLGSAGALGWAPTGTFGAATAAAAQGGWWMLLAHLAVGLLTIVVLAGVWVWAVARRANGSGGTGAVTTSAQVGDLVLAPAALRWLGGGVVAASAWQAWRYTFFRSPRSIQFVLLPLVAALVVGHLQVGSFGLEFGALIVGTGGLVAARGVFNFDNRGFTFLLMTPLSWTRVLLGRMIAVIIFVVPTLLVFLAVEAVWTGRTDGAPTALLIGFSMVALSVGLGALVSITSACNFAAGRRMTPTANMRVSGILVLPLVLFGVVLALRATLLGGVSDVVLALGALVASAAIGWWLFRIASTRLAADPWAVADQLQV